MISQRRMRIMSTRVAKALALILIFFWVTGCGLKIPDFPKIKRQYVVLMVNSNAYCAEYEVISTDPYKIKFLANWPIEMCDKVGGFKPEDVQSILNWKEDVQEWASQHCK